MRIGASLCGWAGRAPGGRAAALHESPARRPHLLRARPVRRSTAASPRRSTAWQASTSAFPLPEGVHGRRVGGAGDRGGRRLLLGGADPHALAVGHRTVQRRVHRHHLPGVGAGHRAGRLERPLLPTRVLCCRLLLVFTGVCADSASALHAQEFQPARWTTWGVAVSLPQPAVEFGRSPVAVPWARAGGPAAAAGCC